ncbi:hypothetical protein MKW98_006408 [Papaver atlanticum]|uniref:Histidine--tRNA ligase, cytoplasmic n=1 Tax=Papaver atlanticum TaxID=357466 RepID=A0AAD4RUW8_9MAGN|nr:hypothetical protein MKW98_006408 [Papaver atlanticum]
MAMKRTTIGGKGSSLTSSSVYFIANGISQVNIDSSILEKLSSSESLPLSEKPLLNIPNPVRNLTVIEARACLVVLLNKLVITKTVIRSVLPVLITDTLNGEGGPFALESLDFGSALGILDSLCKVNGKRIEDVGVTGEEITVLEESCYALDGISALLDCCSSSLSTVADAVAALSCEASSADVSALINFLDSGDGFSDKDMVAVASDFKVLLTGSKLVGKNGSKAVSEIPEVHGSVREIVKQVHSTMRVKLNSSVGIDKDGKLSLSSALIYLGESSLCRAELVARYQDVDINSKVLEMTSTLKDVRNNISSEENSLGLFHEINRLVATVRNLLAWEGALAILSLDTIELKEKAREVQVVPSSVETKKRNANAEKKSQKQKKFVLGKGTAVIKQLLKNRLNSEGGDTIENLAVLNEWVRDLCLFFEPKDPELDTFLKKLKEIVEGNESRRLPKFPKGTRDFGEEKYAIRDKALKIIEGVFKKHGATGLRTPVFELRETLMGKYGEDSKLVYDLADQGGERCSLRYDLTVPFARYVAMNGITSIKRYQIDPVYRRENTSKGRHREFYQCDFDIAIAGPYERMAPDFEVIKVLTELLDELNIGKYEIKLSHRKLLDGMLEICGIPPEKFRTICSSIDKLDKKTFEQIKIEMVEEKGLTAEVADKICTLVQKRGPPLELLSELKQDSQFVENNGSALKDLYILFEALEQSECIHRVVFDLSLARGLDYYTGVIFEAIYKGSTQVGSIGAGGRYDNLVGMFCNKQVPAVGVSLGIERVYEIMEDQQLEKDGNQFRATETEVLVSIYEEGTLSQAAKLVNKLWGANIKAEFMVHKKLTKHTDRAKKSRIPLMVIVGDRERSANQVRIKDMQNNKEDLVDRDSVAKEVQWRLKPTERIWLTRATQWVTMIFVFLCVFCLLFLDYFL